MHPQECQIGDDDEKHEANENSKLQALKWKKSLKKGKKTEIFVWGKARPLNMFKSLSDELQPQHVDRLSSIKVTAICAAREGHHGFAITQSGACWVFGETKQVGALGLASNARATTPNLVQALRKQRVVQACCSAYHSLCITDESVVYGWGSQQHTLLAQDTNTPTPLPFLHGKGVQKLCACNTHSLAWNPNNIEIWSFGMQGPWLGYGRNAGPQRCGIMKLDDSIAKNDNFSITYADCSSEYSLIVSNTGSVGTCGVNRNGRMGIGENTQGSWEVIWNTNLQNIVLCSAGVFHAGFVDTNGRVFTCGAGAGFRLGHGDEQSIWRPKWVASCKHIAVCRIECVDARTFVIPPHGNLLMWGTEPVSGKRHAQPFVFQHLNTHRVYDICAAHDFCVALAVDADGSIPQPKGVKNFTADTMNTNQQISDMNGCIGDVLQYAHPIGVKSKVDTVSPDGGFAGTVRTVQDETPMFLMGKGAAQGIPYPPMSAPPMNTVYASVYQPQYNMNAIRQPVAHNACVSNQNASVKEPKRSGIVDVVFGAYLTTKQSVPVNGYPHPPMSACSMPVYGPSMVGVDVPPPPPPQGGCDGGNQNHMNARYPPQSN